jgi:hypothetical protein
MTAMLRYTFVLLLGIALGALGTIYLVRSDAGNILVQGTDVVKDLQRRLAGVEEQRNILSRQLEEIVSRSARMEQAFNDLERKFRGLTDERGTPAAPEQPPAQAP